MDEQKDTQDLTVSDDGVMSTGDIKQEQDIAADLPVSPPDKVDTEPALEVTPPTDNITPPPMDESSASEDTQAESIAVRTPETSTTPIASNELSDDDIVAQEPLAVEEGTLPYEGQDSITNQIETEVSAGPNPDTATQQIGEKSDHTMHGNSAAPHEHRNNKKFIAFIVILVGLLLAAAAIFVYVSAQKNTAEVPNSPSQNQTTENPTPATGSDIDQTLQEVDASLQSLDDAQDFDEESLSDESLEL